MSKIKTVKLKITLRSDLCASSGYSYAGIVDTDVCYDELGLPYIPARRLRGCFRNTAELIYGEEKVEQIFGKAADSVGGSLKISNARLSDYEAICSELTNLKKVVSSQEVLEKYTRIIGQTKLQNGVAEETSLRYTRVVNHFSPIHPEEENTFEALITCQEEDFNTVKMIITGTKNIGLKRNRGMGAVTCQLLEIKGSSDDKKMNSHLNAEQDAVLEYSFVNAEPLMLSSMSEVHSDSYVRGQSILGLLVGKYLADKPAGTPEFKDLFLNGVTRFTDAYPSETEKEKVRIYYPAPLFVNRTKITKQYVNMLALTNPEMGELRFEAGDQPKKLKGKFLFSGDDQSRWEGCGLKEIEKKLHYHYRRAKGQEEAILYSSEAVEPGQEFSGKIYTKGKYVPILKELLQKGDLRFGKSKGTEYGLCTVTSVIEKKAKNSESIEKGKVVVTLLSDTIFCQDGEYTVDPVQIAHSFGITDAAAIESFREGCLMETDMISGYQTTWNLHKPMIPIVKAGSAFQMDAAYAPSPTHLGFAFVGEKNQEGYGYVQIEKIDQMKKNPDMKKSDVTTKRVLNPKMTDHTAEMVNSILEEKLLAELLGIKISSQTNLLKKVNNTQIGRVTLMLKESAAASASPQHQFKDFTERIRSIKTESVKNAFLTELIKPLSEGEGLAFEKKVVEESGSLIWEQMKQLGYPINEADKLWVNYLMTLLINRKYTGQEA